VDVNAIVQDVVTATHDAYATPIRVHLQPELPPVLGDPIAMRRILDNLVTNAVQSLSGDGGSVTVSSERRGRVIRLVVADTGSGMTPEQLDRALRGFFTTKAHGTGLGLSVVRRLVADHGGEVHIDTTPRRGTTVIVELPVHTASMPPSRATRS
jgi:signal transduction histidine kinase